MNGDFTEARNGKLVLPIEKIDTFGHFCSWIYTRRLPSLDEFEDEDCFDSCLIRLWIFGDAHVVPLLQNEAANRLLKRMVQEWEFPADSNLAILLQYDTPVPPLRNQGMDFISNSGGYELVLKNLTETWSRDALADLMNRVVFCGGLKYTDPDTVRAWDKCKYHAHEARVKCGKSDQEGGEGARSRPGLQRPKFGSLKAGQTESYASLKQRKRPRGRLEESASRVRDR